MVAIVLIGIVAVGSAVFFVHSLDMVEVTRSRRLALELASSRLDDLRAGHYEDVVADADGEAVRVGPHSGTLRTTVTEPDSRDGLYREVVVTVSWTKGARAYRVSTATLIAAAARSE
jgi:type II secretory pathway pseudopilin PulG